MRYFLKKNLASPVKGETVKLGIFCGGRNQEGVRLLSSSRARDERRERERENRLDWP
jgi:hypothetical protein